MSKTNNNLLSWNNNLLLCLQYEKNNNELDLRKKYRDVNIGKWLKKQTKKYKKGKLKESRKEKLKLLNFWNKWLKKFQDNNVKLKKKTFQIYEENKIDEKTNKIDEKTNKIDGKTNKIDEKTNKIDEKKNLIDEKKDRIDGKTNKIDGKTNKIDEKTNKIDEKTNKIDGKTNKIDEKNKKIWNQQYKLCQQYEEIYEFEKTKSFSNLKEFISEWILEQKKKYFICGKGELTVQQRIDLMKLKHWNNWDELYKLSNVWNFIYKLCLEYEDKGYQIIKKTEYAQEKIGKWIELNKDEYLSQKLEKNKLNKLCKLKCWKKWLKSINNHPKTYNMVWDDYLKLCFEYEQKEFYIEKRTIYQNVNIGEWFHEQKNLYLKGKLTHQEYQILSQLRSWNLSNL